MMSSKNENNESSRPGDDAIVIDATESAVPVLSDEQVMQSGSSGRSGMLGWLALLLALLALLAVAAQLWWFWQHSADVDEIGELLTQQASASGAEFDAAREGVERLRQDIQRQLGQRDKQIAQLTSALDEANAIIDGQGRRLLALTATTTDDWRIAEVEYLLRLANQRLLTAGDVSSALELLAAADRILLELNDPRLFELREALAQDRMALAQLGEIDVDGVYLALAALSGNVDQLPLLVVPDFEPGQPEPAASANEASRLPAWSTQLASIGVQTWQELKSLIVIQPMEGAIKPLLPPEQQYYLRSNLRLLISQAQLALLDGRETAYQTSLQSAADWVADYFPADEPAVAAYVDQLNQLLGREMQQALPDVSQSLLAVRAFIAKQHAMARAGFAPAGTAKSDEPEAATDDAAEADTANDVAAERVVAEGAAADDVVEAVQAAASEAGEQQ